MEPEKIEKTDMPTLVEVCSTRKKVPLKRKSRTNIDKRNLKKVKVDTEAIPSFSSMSLYGLANGFYNNVRPKRPCAINPKLLEYINDVEMPIRKSIVDWLYERTKTTDMASFITQLCSIEGQQKKWNLFVKEIASITAQSYSSKDQIKKFKLLAKDNQPNGIHYFEDKCFWQEEIKKKELYWISKKNIAQNIMSYLSLDTSNRGKASISIGPSDKPEDILYDPDGLLTQFVLGLKEGVEETLLNRNNLIINGTAIVKAPEQCAGLLVKRLFCICGINHQQCEFHQK